MITDEDGNDLKDLVGPYNEGESLRLVCSASGGECHLSDRCADCLAGMRKSESRIRSQADGGDESQT